MIDLQERMHLFRSGWVGNQQDFLDYADAQGYRNFAECADYALAILYYSEYYKLRDVWIDAFAHCVGMNDRLVLSPEFEVSLLCSSSLSAVDMLQGTIATDQGPNHPRLLGDGH